MAKNLNWLDFVSMKNYSKVMHEPPPLSQVSHARRTSFKRDSVAIFDVQSPFWRFQTFYGSEEYSFLAAKKSYYQFFSNVGISPLFLY